MEDVRTHDLRGGQREHEQHHEREECAAAHGREPDDEAAARAERNGDDVLPPSEYERRIIRLNAASHERLRDKAESAEDQGGADDLCRGRVSAAAVSLLEPF